MKRSENYHALASRIREATENRIELTKLEKRATTHYNNGTITARDLRDLDTMIMVRLAKLSLCADPCGTTH